MDIVKIFTEPDPIREALSMIDSTYFCERPVIEVTYRLACYEVEFDSILGYLWDVNFSERLDADDNLVDDSYAVVLDLECRGKEIMLMDIIQLKIYNARSHIFDIY